MTNRNRKESTRVAQSQRELSTSNDDSRIRRYSGFYGSLDELFTANISEPEEILYGVQRGQVVQLISVTNAGKSTLMLNVCLALASGEAYPPLVPHPTKPRRIIYFDFEATPGEFRNDLESMIRKLHNQELARQNFVPIVGASVNKRPLNLSVDTHMTHLIRYARDKEADLIVIDPISLAFSLTDENSNAEVIKRVIRPLKRLAARTDAGIVFLHHIGKQYEGSSEGAHQGRGASAFGALARTVFNLTKIPAYGEGYVRLWCSKSKRGRPFNPVVLKLEDRWFRISERQTPRDERLTMQEVASYIASREPEEVRTREVEMEFKVVASKETVKRRLNEAKSHGLVRKVGHGRYRSGSGSPVGVASRAKAVAASAHE
jgi:RecA-family ATPase